MSRKFRIGLFYGAFAPLFLLGPASGQQERPIAVFLGDSIIHVWVGTDGEYFKSNNYFSRGVDGQNSRQILERLENDVIKWRPAAVLILAGTNDIAETHGPVTDDEIMQNLAQMADLASASHIKVVVGTITPANKYWWGTSVAPASRIAEVNSKIKAWALSRGFSCADFWSAMTHTDGTIVAEDFYDGVHPNAKGYAVIEPVAKAAIEEALKSDR